MWEIDLTVGCYPEHYFIYSDHPAPSNAIGAKRRSFSPEARSRSGHFDSVVHFAREKGLMNVSRCRLTKPIEA